MHSWRPGAHPQAALTNPTGLKQVPSCEQNSHKGFEVGGENFRLTIFYREGAKTAKNEKIPKTRHVACLEGMWICDVLGFSWCLFGGCYASRIEAGSKRSLPLRC